MVYRVHRKWNGNNCCLNRTSKCHEMNIVLVQHLPQPDLQKCTVTGRGLQLAETGQPAHFEVHLVGTTGDPCTTEQQVTAELRSNVDGSITSTSVPILKYIPYSIFNQESLLMVYRVHRKWNGNNCCHNRTSQCHENEYCLCSPSLTSRSVQ